MNIHRLFFLIVPAGLAIASGPALAQSNATPETADTIVGSPIETEESDVEDVRDGLESAVENMAETTDKVRLTTAIEMMKVVMIGDEDPKELTESDRLSDLRDALTGNALFAYGLESRGVPVTDVVAVGFEEEGGVTVYALGSPADAAPSDTSDDIPDAATPSGSAQGARGESRSAPQTGAVGKGAAAEPSSQ